MLLYILLKSARLNGCSSSTKQLISFVKDEWLDLSAMIKKKTVLLKEIRWVLQIMEFTYQFLIFNYLKTLTNSRKKNHLSKWHNTGKCR